MGKNETLKLLASVPLFEGLSKKELTTILRASKEVLFPSGRTIVTEGETGAAFHLILEGKAKVIVGGRRTATLGPGDYFGEMSLIDHGLRSATVEASGEVRTLSLVSWSFLPILEHTPAIAKKLLLEMCRRLRAVESRISH